VTDALLALEDGTTFRGESLGALGETFGEVVFNTGMSGYQEVLTDPSYARQIVVMTAPHVGNYGVNAEDPESGEVRVAGYVVREAARRPSSWRSEHTLQDYLAGAGIVGVEGIDTRALTLHIREAGAMRAGISTDDLDEGSLVERVRSVPEMLGADLARRVTTAEPYEASDLVGPARPAAGRRALRVAAFDWGIKRMSLRLLAASGCETVVYPADTPAEEILRVGFDGVFLSNGPGDPAATSYAIDTTRSIVGKVPVFGICLGQQILARAIGGSTYKLKFGHRGINQPVKDLETGRVEITSHNHGFAVDPSGFRGGREDPAGAGRVWPEARRQDPSVQQGDARRAPRGQPDEPIVVNSDVGRVALTHWNLNDGTLEGLRLLEVPGFAVQYHPEAAPGPHDSAYLFDRFVELMEGGG
jgi:carbamoyl-phosphate synthase small subunit